MPDFDTVDAQIIATLGEDVTYTPFGGSSAVVKGFFQFPDDDPDTFEVDIEGNAPQVRLTSTDAPAPQHGDTFIIRGVNYNVKRVEVDESVMVVFHLLES